MTNPFYVASGTPATSSFGASQPMRSEFQAIQGGFEKFPDFTGSAPGTFLINNFTATGITTAPGMVVLPSGNVGIGTNSPAVPLHVVGTGSVGFVGAAIVAQAVDNPKVGLYASRASMQWATRIATSGPYIDGQWILSNENASLDCLFVARDGRVGIGANPGTILDVVKNQNSGTTIRVGNIDPGGSAYAAMTATNAVDSVVMYMTGQNFSPVQLDTPRSGILYTNGSSLRIYTSGVGSPIIMGTANIERMRIDSNGNVGIGAPASSGIVEIVRSQNAGTVVGLSNTNTGNGAYAGYYLSNNTSNGGFIIYGSNYGSGDPKGNAVQLFSSTANGLFLSTNVSAPIIFNTNQSEKMRIDAGGNVGIGMQPTNILDITSNTNAFGAARISNTNGGASAATGWTTYNGSTGTGWYQLGPGYATSGTVRADGLFITSTGVGGTTLATQAPTPLYFVTNSIECMRIDANGNVGIGGPAPGGDIPLYVQRNQATASAIQFKNNNPAGWIQTVYTSDTAQLVTTCYGSTIGGNSFGGVTGSAQIILEAQSCSSFYIGTVTTNAPIIFGIQRVERARLTNTGYIKSGPVNYLSGNTSHEFNSNTAGSEVIDIWNSSGNPNGLYVIFSAAPNNSSNWYYWFADGIGQRAVFYSNGGLGNYAANNVNICDARLKTPLEPYSEAQLAALEASYLNVNWGRYKYLDQTHDDWNHGTTAQNVESAFTVTALELVDELNIGPKDGPALMRKGIYETDLTNISRALLAKVMKDVAMLKTYLPRA